MPVNASAEVDETLAMARMRLLVASDGPSTNPQAAWRTVTLSNLVARPLPATSRQHGAGPIRG
jgi:hypothetical protein